MGKNWAKIDMSGKTFGLLLVVGESPFRGGGLLQEKVYWDCVCKCGKEVRVFGGDLRSGKIKSCGCLSKFMRKQSEDLYYKLLFSIPETLKRIENKLK